MWRSARRAEFEQLVRDHLSDALRLALRLTRCPDDAEDIVQTALLRASRGWTSFRGDSQFRTWLFRIVINVHRDSLRKKKRTIEPLPPSLPDRRHRDPRIETIESELEEQLAQCVTKLPPRQREVLILSTYEELTAGEIAELLEITTTNVHATLHLARKRLKELLQPYFAET